MSATVHDVWAGALPPGTQLVGGQRGLDREVRWVITLRPRPPGLVGLKGGELVLVGADTLRALDDRLTLARAIDQLSQAGVAAVAARGGIDQAAIARADALGFPLLSIPVEASLTQSEQDALRLLADRQAETLELTRQVQQQLTELLIAGHGLPAIVDRLAVLTRRAVAVEDASGIRQLSGAAVSLPDRTQVVEALERTRPRLLAWIDGRRVPAADPPTQRFRLEIDGIGRIVAPIAADDGALAFLSLIAPHESLGRSDALSASQGATVCALVLARERAVLQAEDRLRRDVVTDLLSGAFTSDSALLERAERLGFNLSLQHLPIALRIAAEPPAATPRSHDVVSVLVRELGRLGVCAPIGVLGETIGLAFPLDGGEPAAVAAKVHRLVAQVSGRTVSAGVGRPGIGPAAIAQGYREADRALVIARRLFPPGALTFFQNLGVHRLLLALDGHPELGAFYEETLAAIDQYDRTNRSELLSTLEAFFAADNSLAETASRLHLHRNTVAYRLRRIEQISGHQLGDPETRLALHLGLRVRHALAAREPDAEHGMVAALAPDRRLGR
ncbi:MAG TPA: helix-turn-helix domain-containing protein [Chloroflexota bacterium]|nr:helix-turn-helix domain-containing protein [Chloroflexota bacterium]